ncbi:hypothetical protein EC991_009250 [Linnemannia zychae]|nr:hypothetical protein EC991_009250 [Linnemannia zychae]
MDPLSQLPLECLQHILRTLDDDDSLDSLANLLTMSKYFASVVLPFLYRDPYRLIFHQNKQRYLTGHKNTTYELLTRTLLGRLPITSLPKPLVLALTTSPVAPGTSTTTYSTTTIDPVGSSAVSSLFDYLAHIRHFSTPGQDVWEQTLLTTDLLPHQLAYIQSDEFDQIYQSQPFATTYAAYFRTKNKLLEKYYRTIINLDALWCLADPILEQLQSFTIPVRLIKRYRELISRFKSLESIQFAMSQMFEEPFYSDKSTGLSRPPNDEVLLDMVEFVLEHSRLFKDQLKFIGCFDSGVWDWMDWSSIDCMELDFFRQLPPMDKPTRLDKDNWRRFSAHPQSTDLAHVREFSSSAVQESWQDIICNNQSILQRCRSLNRLDLLNFRAGAFKWAVQEKRELGWTGRVASAVKSDGGQGVLVLKEEGLETRQTHSLVPLERVYIKQQLIKSGDDIDDIAFAFNQTLKHFEVSAQPPFLRNRSKLIHVGRGWVDLPALTLLNLEVDSDHLVLEPRLLTHCPNLKFLVLSDMSRAYQCKDVAPCLPTSLEQLGSLQLNGWPALAFDPATLSSTTRLEIMKIRVQPWRVESSDPMKGYIPPVEELNESYGIQNESAATPIGSVLTIIRPRWTWDWELPLLTQLHLSSEFAYLFKFKVLYGCPALEQLHLDISSTSPREHTRVISDSDLVASISNIKAVNRLLLPSLSFLSLSGEWVVEDGIMHRLLTEVFPGIKELYLSWWNITTLESLFEVFRAVPQQFDSSVFVSISKPSPDDMTSLRISENPLSENAEGCFDVNIVSECGSSRYFILK